MIPEDVTGHVVKQVEVCSKDEADGAGVILLNKPDGPGRWHWQIVDYMWSPEHPQGLSTDAYSHDLRVHAITHYDLHRQALLAEWERPGVVVRVLG